nr:hypothetical protein FFPRI1PSEUD_61330 [Pseudomonas sp. FFPRI_1]
MPKLNRSNSSVDANSGDNLLKVQLVNESNSLGDLPSADASRDVSMGTDLPNVAILLRIYYGQRYLAEQLASFEAQNYSNWQVWASDEGSEDDTRAILEA